MTYEEISEALRVCGRAECDGCLTPETDCGSLCTAAADAIEDLQQLADNSEKERRCLEEEVHRLNDGRHRDTIELACKNTEIEILRRELRRMFRLYVAAETRADAGTKED